MMTATGAPPRPPRPRNRVATGSPEPEPRRHRTNVLYAVERDGAELAGPRPMPVVPEAPPTRPPADIGQGIAILETPWVRRGAMGIATGLGVRFVAAPIAGMFLSQEQESAIASIPGLGLLTGYHAPEERRREILAGYI